MRLLGLQEGVYLAYGDGYGCDAGMLCWLLDYWRTTVFDDVGIRVGSDTSVEVYSKFEMILGHYILLATLNIPSGLRPRNRKTKDLANASNPSHPSTP